LERLRNNTLKQQIEEAQNAIKLVSDEFISVKTKKEQFHSMLSNADLRREDILEKIESLSNEIADMQPKAQIAQRELNAHDEKLKLMVVELTGQNELLSQKSAAYNEQNIFFHQQENRVKSVEQESASSREHGAKQLRIQTNAEELHKNEEEIQTIATTASPAMKNSSACMRKRRRWKKD